MVFLWLTDKEYERSIFSIHVEMFFKSHCTLFVHVKVIFSCLKTKFSKAHKVVFKSLWTLICKVEKYFWSVDWNGIFVVTDKEYERSIFSIHVEMFYLLGKLKASLVISTRVLLWYKEAEWSKNFFGTLIMLKIHCGT